MILCCRKTLPSPAQPERRSGGRAHWRCDRVQRRKRGQFVKLFGTIDFRPDWDYRKARLRSRV